MAKSLPPSRTSVSSAISAQGGFAAGAAIIRDHLKRLPAQPGVYRFIDPKGEILYVGKAKNLPKRVQSYTQQTRLPIRLQRMVARVHSLEVTVTRTEAEALLLEANLIKKHQPRYNVLLRDAKDFAYILLTNNHPYPLLTKFRGARKEDGWYYGPFASAGAVNQTLQVLQRGFLLRNCPDTVFAQRQRPCLQYQIKRCTAPCVGRVSEADYAEQVRQARGFLSGRSHDIQKALASQMQAASDAQDYERAAALRDRLKALADVQARQDINLGTLEDVDVFALAREGGQVSVHVFFCRQGRNYGGRAFFPKHEAEEIDADIFASFLAQFYVDRPVPREILLKTAATDMPLLAAAFTAQAGHRVSVRVPKQGSPSRLALLAEENARLAIRQRLAENASQQRLLSGLADLLTLEAPPARIEIFDNSHSSGTNPVGGMVVAGPDGFIKNAYRKFNLRSEAATKGDDYAMMEEMLRRRFTRAVNEEEGAALPDLVLIDGGAGQLSRAHAVLAELGLSDLPVAAIAKGPDRNAGREKIFMEGRAPFQLPPDDPVLFYLQRLRDEAHRFAIGTHRARRTKSELRSSLDSVPGIGPARKRALLRHFGSAAGVAKAQVSDLRAVDGVSAALAEKIYAHFHEGTSG